MSRNSIKHLSVVNYSTPLKKKSQYLNTIACPLYVLLSKLFSPILLPCNTFDLVKFTPLHIGMTNGGSRARLFP